MDHSVKVLDWSHRFRPDLVGSSLAKLWAVEGTCLVPAVDGAGQEAKCPITQQVIKDPVLADNGIIYEKEAILQWLQGHDGAPGSEDIVRPKTVLKIRTMRSAVEAFLRGKESAITQALAQAATVDTPAEMQAVLRCLEAHTTQINTEIKRLENMAVCAQEAAKDLHKRIEPALENYNIGSPQKVPGGSSSDMEALYNADGNVWRDVWRLPKEDFKVDLTNVARKALEKTAARKPAVETIKKFKEQPGEDHVKEGIKNPTKESARRLVRDADKESAKGSLAEKMEEIMRGRARTSSCSNVVTSAHSEQETKVDQKLKTEPQIWREVNQQPKKGPQGVDSITSGNCGFYYLNSAFAESITSPLVQDSSTLAKQWAQHVEGRPKSGASKRAHNGGA